MERNKAPNMVGFYTGRGRVTENTLKTDSTPSKASNQEERTSDKDNSEQSTPEVPSDLLRVAAVTITESGSEDADGDNKENLEQALAHNDVAKCGAVNGSTEGLEWNGDTVVDGGDLEWDDDDDDDENGWITPENFHQACEEMGGVSEEKVAGIAVGCTTTDFAMQVHLIPIKGRARRKEKGERWGREQGGRGRERDLRVLCALVLCLVLPERDASDGSECDLCGWNENQAATNVCNEVQSLLQVNIL